MTPKQYEKLKNESQRLQMEISQRLTEPECVKLNRIIELELLLEAECNQ
jgi:hypothetical protein